jgi:probable rRNA maturation factor
MLDIEIQDECATASTPTKELFATWANAALATETDKELIIRLVATDESAFLNKTYRSKDRPTNVLSFADEAIPGFPAESFGTLVMCPDVIDGEAKQLETPILEHWAHLTIHGMLHLQGHDHIDDDEALLMEAEEIKILARFNIANPYTINKG